MDENNKKRRLGAGTSSASSSTPVSNTSTEPSIAQYPDLQQKTTTQPPVVQGQTPSPASQPTAPGVLPKKKPRFCQFCRNHGLSKTTKGHKKYCKYRFCISSTCKCVITRERHRAMAKQVAIKREKELALHLAAMNQEEDREPSPEVIPKPDNLNINNVNDINGTGPPSSSLRIMWERILTVIVKKGYRIDTYPLLYIILKEVTNDVEEVCNKIAQSQLELAQRNIEPLIIQAMTQLEPVAAAHSAGVPVVGYQYWLDGFDLRGHTVRIRHSDPYTEPDHEPQLRPSGSPLSEHNAFPSSAEIPFYFMSQERNVRGVEDRAGEFIFSTRTHLSKEGFTV